MKAMLKQFCFLGWGSQSTTINAQNLPFAYEMSWKEKILWLTHWFFLLCCPSTNPTCLSKQSILRSAAQHQVRHANSSPQPQCISPLCEQHLPPVPKRLQTAACEGLSPREHQKNFRLRIWETSMWDSENLSKGAVWMGSLCSCLFCPRSPQIIPVSCEACILFLPFQSNFL